MLTCKVAWGIVIATGTLAVGAFSAGYGDDIQRDRREIHRDAQDIRVDNKAIRQDWRERRQELWEGDLKGARRETREIRRMKADRRRDLHKDQAVE
jgi:hypothetical protein